MKAGAQGGAHEQREGLGGSGRIFTVWFWLCSALLEYSHSTELWLFPGHGQAWPREPLTKGEGCWHVFIN